MRKQQTLNITVCAMMVAVMAILSLIAIPLPITPIPITLQTAAVILSAIILGPKRALIVMIIYLIIGCIGLPVFAGGKAGFAVLAGSTGGFLIGFLPAVLAGGFIYNLNKTDSVKRALLVSVIISVIFYTFGIIYFAIITETSLYLAFLSACLPFLPGDIIKIAIFAPLAVSIRKRLKKQMPDFF